MRVILLGPPGSGKGTQGDLIEKKYGFPRVSTGDLLRREIQVGSLVGRKAVEDVRLGGLVSDDIIEEIIRMRIAEPDCRRGYVLDGFPRTIAQAEMLEVIDMEKPEVAIDLVIDDMGLLDRLKGRRICSRCGAVYHIEGFKPEVEGVCDICGGPLVQREDDSDEVIIERLRVFRKHTEPLKKYYGRKRVYHEVDGRLKIGEIFSCISAILDDALAGINRNEAQP